MLTSIEVDLVDSAEFFAPVSSDMIDGLIGQYDNSRRRITDVASYMHECYNFLKHG